MDETLAVKRLLPDDLVYSSIIDYLTITLKLDQWNWFIENSVRQLLHRDFIDAADLVAERQIAVIWPGTKPELEAAIKNLMQSYLDYIWQYISFAIPRQSGESYAADTTYKQIYPNPHYDFYSDKHDLWARKNFILLCLYTAHLNDFAKAVRKYSNPHFYIVKGKFLVIDSLGTHLGNWGSMLDPNISNLQKSLKKIENEYIKFQKKHEGKQPISARKLTL